MSSQRTAIVTGGLNGIGQVIASTLLSEGLNVVVADIAIPADQTQSFINPFTAHSEDNYLLLHCDVSNEEHVKNVVAKTIEKFSSLHCVINNAAFSHPRYHAKDITGLSLDEWNKVIGVNLTSIFLTTKHATPFLRQSKGCIINMSSSRALQSEPNTEIYAASKGGVLSLTHSLAISLGPEINVNAISPGWIDVGSYQVGKGRDHELQDYDHKQHPVGRVGKPEDIAKMCMYLINDGCQPESGFITGQNFVIDGGMTKKMIYAGEPWWLNE